MQRQITTQTRAHRSKQGFPLMIVYLVKNKIQWQDRNSSQHTSINMDNQIHTASVAVLLLRSQLTRAHSKDVNCSVVLTHSKFPRQGTRWRERLSFSSAAVKGSNMSVIRSEAVGSTGAVWTWSREAKQQTHPEFKQILKWGKKSKEFVSCVSDPRLLSSVVTENICFPDNNELSQLDFRQWRNAIYGYRKGCSGAWKKYIVKSKSDAAVDSGEEKVHWVWWGGGQCKK